MLGTCDPVYDGSYVNCSIILGSWTIDEFGEVNDLICKSVYDFSWFAEKVCIVEKGEFSTFV